MLADAAELVQIHLTELQCCHLSDDNWMVLIPLKPHLRWGRYVHTGVSVELISPRLSSRGAVVARAPKRQGKDFDALHH